MDVPHKRIQTLSMTRYDYDGKVQSHGAGSKDRETIAEGSPMEKYTIISIKNCWPAISA